MLTLSIFLVAKGEHAGIDEQTAIAVFREPRETVDIDDLDARGLQRLDQGVCKPLRELVQRYQAVRGVVGDQRGMLPAVAERDPTERQPRRPDRSELLQQFGQDDGSGKATVFGARGQLIEQAAGTRRVVTAEYVRLGRDELAEAAQKIDAAFKSDQRIGIGNLQTTRHVGDGEMAENIRIDAKRTLRIGREKSTGEHPEAC